MNLEQITAPPDLRYSYSNLDSDCKHKNESRTNYSLYLFLRDCSRLLFSLSPKYCPISCLGHMVLTKSQSLSTFYQY